MRFISKVLKDTLHEKFPDATEDELLKVCLYLWAGCLLCRSRGSQITKESLIVKDQIWCF